MRENGGERYIYVIFIIVSFVKIYFKTTIHKRLDVKLRRTI